MDRIRVILQFQWRAYWRRFHGAGNLRASNLGPLILFGVLAFIRYLQQLPLVAAQMAEGETAKYQTLLLVVFLASAFAVMGESRRSITSRNLLHLPLSAADLFLIRLGSIFCSPISWLVVAASLTLSYPIVGARHPVAGMMALLLFLLFSLFTGLTITHLLNSSLVRRLLLVVLFLGSVIGGLLWLGTRTELIGSVRWLSPAYLTAAAAVSPLPFGLLAALAMITALAGWLALRTFTRTLQPRQDRRSSGFTLLGSVQFPGRFGGLLKKDLRYAGRLLDIYLALPVVIVFNLYLTVSSAVVLAIIVGFLFLPSVSLAFNCFGLESPLGLDRYTLFPLSEKEKLLSKNLSFATLMMGLFLLILPLTLWKLGVWTSVLALIELIVVGLAYVTYGNWLSVKHPFKMQFYRFASGGSPVDALMGMIFGSVPVAATAYLAYHEVPGTFWKMGLMMLAYLALFLFSLSRSARVFAVQREAIRRTLS